MKKLSDRVTSYTGDAVEVSGVTGLVSQRLGRECVLVDLNAEYQKLQRERVRSAIPKEVLA